AEVDADVLAWPRPRISAWREDGGQAFLPEDELVAAAEKEGFERVPRLGSIDAAELPAGIAGMQEFLAELLPATRAALDDGAGGRPEGVVLRTPDRSAIAKARFQDYRRTPKRRRCAPTREGTGPRPEPLRGSRPRPPVPRGPGKALAARSAALVSAG